MNESTVKNVIIQAGGRGSRLRHHTWNKPKCLVSVRGKPLLYHFFDKFKDAKFFIIGDYMFDKLESYLKVNDPEIDYSLIHTNEKGTASGIKDALEQIDDEESVLISWSDLIIGSVPDFYETSNPIVITTNAFTCRWTFNNILAETPGPNGIPGLFFCNKSKNFPTPPNSGEFVKWFSNTVTKFDTIEHNDLEELGDFSTIENQNDRAGFSRFFNEVKILEKTVEKRAIDKNYSHLINNEISWYKSVGDLGFRRIPEIFSTDPLTMQRIKGQHAYQMNDLNDREKRAVLADYIDSLVSLHDLGTRAADKQEVKDTYISKTIDRVNSVSSIIPNFDKKSITVNGKKCRNIFQSDDWSTLITEIQATQFTPIHGDPTFSNTLIDKNLRTWFIDPRGYFAKQGSIWGDPMYDFAKLYYSAVGGYDNFNRRKFKLHVDQETVEILYEKPTFYDTGIEIFKEHFANDLNKIEILHGLIWLSLSGYAKDDIDSVIGSFYLGLYWLEQGISK